MRWLTKMSVGLGVLGGLAFVLPASPAGAVPIFPGSQGNLSVIFNNTGKPGFNTGPAAVGVGAFRMDTGAGTGSQAGGKVFLHSSELDGQPVTALTSFSYQYFIDSTSAVSLTPFPNLRVENQLFGGARTLTVEPTPGVIGEFATVTVPTGATPGWAVTGAQLVCNGVPVPFNFSLQELATICPGTNIVAATGLGAPGGISIVTGLNDGAGWAGWTGVIDDLRINASQYDLEPARITITPASPATLPSRDPQTVTFTLQASGWNTFFGLNTTPVVDQPIVGGYDMQVGFRATGATTVTGLAGTVPIASQASQLTSPPPPVTFTLDVTAALIGSGNSITVDWIAPPATGQLPTPGVALNAITDPDATILQLPPPPTTTTTAATTTTTAAVTTTTSAVTTTTAAVTTTTAAVTVGPTTTAPRRPSATGPQTLPATGPRDSSEHVTEIALGSVVIGVILVLVARRRVDEPR